MKKFITVFLIIAIIVGGLLLLKKRKADLAKAKPAAVLPALVKTVELKRGPVTLTLPAMGIVASDVSAVLSTKVSGEVRAVYKQEGDTVKKGDVLARIDTRELEAKKQALLSQQQGIGFQIEAKKADAKALETALSTAKETHSRTDELLRVKGASIEQFSQETSEIARIEANLSAARNSVASLEKNRETLSANIREIDSLKDYATVTSPIGGTLSQSLIKPGDLATPGKPLFRVASKSGLYLNLSMPDTVHPSEIIVNGQTLRLTPKDHAGATGLIQYVAQIPGGQDLVEGQYVNVRVIVFTDENVRIPVDALLTMDGSSSVFALTSKGIPERLTVHIQARGAEGVVVRENLAGKRVIIAKPDILLRVAAGVPVAAIKS